MAHQCLHRLWSNVFWDTRSLICLNSLRLLCPQVERGSPKSCFLYLGEVLCEVNWLSVLSDHFQTPSMSEICPTPPDTQKQSHTMVVYLLYMLVFLAKEEEFLSQKVCPHLCGGFLPPFSITHDFFFLPQLPGLPSTQSFGPVQLSSLASVGLFLIPGHSGLCQYPLPSLCAAH